MGVEYQHFLVVNDPNWRPQPDTAERVEAVLQEWGIVDQPKRAFDLAGGRCKEIPAPTTAIEPGPGFALEYAGVSGEAVERIAGPSYRGFDPSERYTMRTWLILGHDYRVHYGSESIYCEVVSPPTIDGQPIEPYEESSDGPLLTMFAESFPAAGATSPPVVRCHVEDHARDFVACDGFQGFWRGALIIDFGKDLPAFIEARQLLPARAFVAAIADAFRGPVAEIGEIY